MRNEKNQGTDRPMKAKGIWARFLHTFAAADIPRLLLAFYIFLTIIEGQILIRIPEVNGNFFAGDVSVGSVTMFLVLELVNMVVCQFVLYINHILRYRMNRNLRNTLWRKILHLKPSYYSTVSPSSLISRITTDSDSINSFVMDVVIELGVQIYYMVLTVNEMSKVSIKVGLMLLGFMPLTFFLSFVFGRIGMRIENSIRASLSDFTTFLSEIIAVLPLLKSLNRQVYETKRGEAVIEQYYVANRKAVFLQILSDFVHAIADIGPELVIFILGIRYLNDGTFEAETWYMFYIYAGSFIGFCGTLGTMWTSSKHIQGSLYKISEILYEESECLDSYVKEIEASGDIALDDVSFSYEENCVIQHASCTFTHHQVNMLIGPSGAGKSTLTKLIERLYEPSQGRILMGGQDISTYSVRDWRNNVAYVSQRTPLFSGSLRENILYGIKRQVSDEEIMKVCALTRLDSFIASLEDGLAHEVGQFGNKLSGGQKQKVSVTRALLSDADILILDEPTASFDITSTHEIMDTIDSLKGKKTLIVVSHDREVIGKGDHYVVLNADHTIDEGNREEILRRSSYYRALKQGKEDVTDVP